MSDSPTAEKQFTLTWTCQPKTALPEVQSGTETVRAENLVVACGKVKRLIAARLHCTTEQVQIGDATFIMGDVLPSNQRSYPDHHPACDCTACLKDEIERLNREIEDMRRSTFETKARPLARVHQNCRTCTCEEPT